MNPSKYVDVLLDIKDELYDKYRYVKTERDIADQLIKVLPKEFEHTRNKLRDLRRDRALIDLSKIQEELQEIYDNLKDKRKKSKKSIEISEDSEDDKDDDKALMITKLCEASRQGSILRDPQNPNIAYIVVDGKPNYNPNLYSKQFKGICYRCGEWGHKGTECTGKKKEENDQNTKKDGPQPKCIHCGSYYHNSLL